MTTVLVADDQDVVRSGLRLILEVAGLDVVAEAEDGAQAVAVAERLRPDVALMDVRMPGTDGIAATRRIVGAGLDTRVLILTTFDLDEHVFAALRAGASGFLLKDVGRHQLVEAVRTVAAGEALFAPSVLRRLVDHYVARPALPAASAGLPGLTAREREILGLIGRGRSNTDIAAELVISMATVKTHVRHLLQKLALRDRAQAVVLAYESGLVVPGSPPPP
ncbi:response regulator transcription factor [Dactylosporangium sp. AC04546]|uniref:response regulator n=1 Tax=Dactylosporangium sp. AC04546 TaxID=2862460 RepID=UPI001EDD1AC7|nr:response regulator transcription factor [Dactylosporangium sp. AC04546]WVK78661.1 response regulator transcription factor [Dactylosporangium sp. AC04546]